MVYKTYPLNIRKIQGYKRKQTLDALTSVINNVTNVTVNKAKLIAKADNNINDKFQLCKNVKGITLNIIQNASTNVQLTSQNIEDISITVKNNI